MKKALTIVLSLIMALSLTACGGKQENSSKKNENSVIAAAENTTKGGANTDTPNTDTPNTDTPDSDTPNMMELKVEKKSDRVVTTSDDGAGNTIITEYIYKDGVMSDINMTMHCSSIAAAKVAYETYTNGTMEEYGDNTFSDVKLEGDKIFCTYNEEYASAFSIFSMDQLAATFEGVDPYAIGGISEGVSDTAEESETDETTYNFEWSELKLPDGFPQLDKGVTGFNEFEGGNMLTWNAMALSDLDEMIGKIEAWSGLTLEIVMELDGSKAWAAQGDTMAISINYFEDALDAQVMISIQEF